MKARFEVSTEGMRALHAGREPWQLAKELVSNAWDEAITRCDVTLASLSPRKAKLTVYDDGKGFADIKDSWTLMGDTIKRRNPTVRGRFNIGEKEILSIADAAVVHTNSTKVVFPKSGGRQVRKAKPIKGTVVVCTLPWGSKQVEDTVEALKKLLVPEGITYTVNGYEVPHLKPYKVIEGVVLETVLQDSPTEPMRSTQRKTNVLLYKSSNGKATLYELGIPVQTIDCAFSVNIQQKVPLPPNRDVVRDSYLQDVYRLVLETTKDELKEPSATWVHTALEDKDIAPDTVKAVMDKRYGEKAVLWSTDTEANERAEQAGYTVVHPRTLSAEERESMATKAGLVHSSDKYPSPYSAGGAPLEFIPEEKWSDGMRNVAEYAQMLGKELLHDHTTIRFYRYFKDQAAARGGKNTIEFNMAKLRKSWFDEVGAEQTALILHEMSHCGGAGHDWQYQKLFERLSGEAVHLALEKPELFRKFIK